MRGTKKVLISALLFLGVGLVFGTVSYAWFSLSLTNNIEGLTLTASTGDELQISFDGINFSSELPMDELIKDPNGVRLFDVTSIDGINFETGGLRPKGVAIPNEHYLSFDVWFRTSQNEHSVYLYNDISDDMTYDSDNQVGTYVVSKGVVWRAPHQFFNGPNVEDVVLQGEVGTYYGSDAMRIAVIELNDELNPLDVREESELKRFIFDPSGDPMRGYAATFGQFSYFFQRTLIYVELPTEIPVVSYRLSEMDRFNPYQALDNESLVSDLQPTGLIDEKTGKEIYQGKVRVNIWIEGWDADAFDALDKDRMKIQLQFKLANKAMN